METDGRQKGMITRTEVSAEGCSKQSMVGRMSLDLRKKRRIFSPQKEHTPMEA